MQYAVRFTSCFKMYKSSKRTSSRKIGKERDVILEEIRRAAASAVCTAEFSYRTPNHHAEERLPSTEELDDVALSDSDSDIYTHRFSDSSDCEDGEGVKDPLQVCLVSWVHEHMITQTATDALLKIIKPFVNVTLPVCARTLMQTPRNLSMTKKCGGEIYYFGCREAVVRKVKSGLKSVLPDGPYFTHKSVNMISMSVGFDGVPVARSSNGQFWPLLGVINQAVDQCPFLIALFYGHSKPSNLSEYLEDFIAEIKLLRETGICISGVKYDFDVSFFTADAPARSMLKSCKGHGGYYGCERCTVEGDYVNHRVVFLNDDCSLRSDASFANQSDENHHVGVSPLLELGIGMVTQFPYDYMHLVCLGVGRKILLAMVNGNASKKVKLRGSSIAKVSDRLLRIAHFFPVEFARRPRSLSDLAHYKATEFRTFLLYSGPYCLKDIVDADVYRHFLLLTSAMYILLSPKASQSTLNATANELLRKFVSQSVIFYGEQFMTYNVHSLIHLAKDSVMYGKLDNFSAFGFENYMQTLKRFVQGKKHYLAQVVSRVLESENVVTTSKIVRRNGYVDKSCSKKYYYNNILISELDGNNCFLTNDCNVVIITGLQKVHEGFVKCKRFKKRVNVPEFPVDSSLLCIYKCDGFCEEELISVKKLMQKCVCLPENEDSQHFICFPLMFNVEHNM